MKKLFILLSAIVCSFATYAQTFTQGNLTYTVINKTDKKVNVKASDKNISGDIIIPEQVTNDDIIYTVTNLESVSFSYCG